MKLRIALLSVALGSVHAAAAQNMPNANQPIVHSGLFSIRADGKASGAAMQTGEFAGDDLAGTLYLSPCSGLGASSIGREVSAFATDVWVMSGKVLELTEQHASVQVGWRRTRRAGQEESTPEQSTTLTLARGDRRTLEVIVVPASAACDARTVNLDVAFSSRSELYGIGAADAARGGGRSSGTSSAGRVPEPQRAASKTDGMAISTGGGGSGSTHPGLQRLTADLWLVRSTPGAADQTLHATAALIPAPVSYAFPPLTIQTAGGAVSVKVEGTIEVGVTPEGEKRIHFIASRSVTSLTSSRPARDSKSVVEGSTKTMVNMPDPDEVLSFEMPALRTADGVTLPDGLSIRLRVNTPPGR